MRGKFINDKIFFWNLVVFFVFSRVRVRVRGELASNFQGIQTLHNWKETGDTS
jgi:hypothetical protein